MGLLDVFRRERAEPTNDEIELTPHVDDVLLSALLSNETISRDKALTLPAVSSAVDLISNCVASMSVKLYKTKKGKVEEVTNDYRTTLLNKDTGDTLDAFQLKKAMVSDYLLGKGGYCYIKRKRNTVTGLYYVEDRDVSIITNTDPIFKSYSINVGAKSYEQFDFIKLLRNTKDGASGTGVTYEVSKALETAYRTLLYQLGLVKTGGNKKGFIKSNKRLTQESIDLLKKAWNNLYSNNTENVVVLNDGLDFQESSNTSVEMQLNENKKTLQEEINGIFHIHQDSFDQTFKEAIYPIVKAFETALNRDLLLEREKKSMYFEFDVKEIVKANLVERYNAYKTAKETGFMTLNEIRKAENMNYIDGLDVINVGLSSVLYNVDTQTYFTPNTGAMQGFSDSEENANVENVVEENKKTLKNGGDNDESDTKK